MNAIPLLGAVALAAFAFFSAGTHAAVSSVSVSSESIHELIGSNDIHPNRLLVKYTSSAVARDFTFATQLLVSESRAFYAPKNLLASSTLPDLSGWRVLTFGSGVNLGEVFDTLKSDPNVERVVPDIRVRVAAIPDDLVPELWGLHNTAQSGGTDDADIDAVEAWDIRTSSNNIVVAVIDTGVDYTHPDLAANMWVNPGEIAGNGLDDDNNGYVDDIHGWDFVNNDADPMDDNEHGTHVSGTIAAVGDNGVGVVGVAWNAQLMALKFLDANGNGYSADAIDALLYAVDNGATISNNSWGSFSSTFLLEVFDTPLADAIALAGQQGHLFVTAAGNNSYCTDGSYSAYPAGITHSNILTVAATDHNDELALFSNFGVVEVDIAAPGVGIYSTMPDNSYGFLDGTSMATPHVVGAAALVSSWHPELSPEEVKAVLMNTSDAIPGLEEQVGSGGRLNIASALGYLEEGPSCQSFVSTAAQHITEGRAHQCGFFNLYACANGSNANLGSRYGSSYISLIESAPGYFEEGSCNGVQLDLPPVIQLQGEKETRILIGTSYQAPINAATATDREDGDISSAITVSDNVDTGVAGVYSVDYSVTDSSGNPAVVERRLVQVLEDDLPPEVILFGPQCRLPLYCESILLQQGDSFEEPGYIAADEIDGDLTDQVVLVGDPLDTNVIGRYKVQYDVTDSAGQDFHYKEHIFRDVFVLHEDEPYVHIDAEDEEFYHAEGVCCLSSRIDPFSMDLIDGLNAVETEGELNQNVAGTYVLRHHFTDSEGFYDERYQIIHVIPDVTPPTIELNGDAEVSVPVGESWSDPWARATDDLDEYPNITREGNFDTDVVGVYELNYFATDDTGNESARVTRILRVVAPCEEFTDSNSGHITAGRAHQCGLYNLYACANGSGDDLGSRWAYGDVTIHQTDEDSNTYYAGSCPN